MTYQRSIIIIIIKWGRCTNPYLVWVIFIRFMNEFQLIFVELQKMLKSVTWYPKIQNEGDYMGITPAVSI